MLERASFAYAQARMQAHHGQRPTKATWRSLNASKSLAHYLDSARQTGLKRWVTHLSGGASAHAIEQALRREWQAYVAMLATWLPAEWRASVQWTGGLVDVPMTVHVARGQAAPEWSSRDREKTVLSQKSDPDWAATSPMAVWLNHFKALSPSADDTASLEHLIDVLRRDHGADQPANTLDGVEFRYQLIAKVERLFRRHAQQPVAVFAFLALVAMDLEHLRAHLIHRCLFPETLDNR